MVVSARVFWAAFPEDYGLIGFGSCRSGARERLEQWGDGGSEKFRVRHGDLRLLSRQFR